METAKTPDAHVLTTDALTAEQLATARAVLTAAAAEDGREAVSEAGRLRLRPDSPRPGVRHLLGTTAAPAGPGAATVTAGPAAPAGYAQLELPEPTAQHPTGPAPAATVELAVHPARRGRGFGRALVEAVLAAAGRDRTVDFWAHGGHPAAARLAERYGAELVRELRQMRRTGTFTVGEADTPLPVGVELRTFRPGEDDEAWLRLNALAFAHHPEQGSWTAGDLADRLAEPWFDPAGFFLAFRGQRLVGFHWTKTHPATATDPALGEVYVVGVDPAEQGSGLGRALTAAGLRHLTAARGLESVLLYVDADNPAAVRVYERLGFTVHEVDLMYRVPAATAAG